MHSFSVTFANIAINDISLKLDSLGYIFVEEVLVYLRPLWPNQPESYRIRWDNAKQRPLRHSRLFKVTVLIESKAHMQFPISD